MQLNQDGDVFSIYDKRLNKELLSAPIRLANLRDVPKQYPAWNMDFDQEQAAPRAYVSGPAQIRIKENGPVRVSVEVTRNTEDSTFVQTIRPSAGDAGNTVESANAIDWRTLAANLKVAFLSAQPTTMRLTTGMWEPFNGPTRRKGNLKSPPTAGSISPTRAAPSERPSDRI